MRIDRAFIEAHKTGRGGWKAKQIKALGEPWPPVKGWIDRAIAKDHTEAAIAAFTGQKSPKRMEDVDAKLRATVKAKIKAMRVVVSHKPLPSPASKEFLYTYEWRRVRMEALKKYGARCQCCGATPALGAVMNVDHIKPRALFPALALDVDNLQVLCSDCNHGKGNWDMTDWREATHG